MSAASWVKKVGGGATGSCFFLTDSCRFPREEIMGARNFNFASKFFQNGRLLALNSVFLKTIFSQEEHFSTG